MQGTVADDAVLVLILSDIDSDHSYSITGEQQLLSMKQLHLSIFRQRHPTVR